MSKLVRTAFCLILLTAGLLVSACAGPKQAREQDLTGQAHERHATGIASQVGDN